MSLIKKMATAGVVAVMGMGLGAASASAYTIDGISGNPFEYTGTPTAVHSFTVDGAYIITCPIATTSFTGDAVGTDKTVFTPYYGANDPSVPPQSPPYDTGYNCEFFGFPARVTQDGPWEITVDNQKSFSPEVYGGTITIPSGTSTTIEVPIADCKVVVSGPQSFADGVNGNIGEATDTGSGVELEAVVNDVALTSVGGISGGPGGCPFTASATAVYNTNGPVSIPGIEIN